MNELIAFNFRLNVHTHLKNFAPMVVFTPPHLFTQPKVTSLFHIIQLQKTLKATDFSGFLYCIKNYSLYMVEASGARLNLLILLLIIHYLLKKIPTRSPIFDAFTNWDFPYTLQYQAKTHMTATNYSPISSVSFTIS